jgi:hypothetical protein
MSGWVAGAVAVGTIGGAYLSSQAAKSAASTQAAAADRATAAQQAGLAEQTAINAPFVDKGTAALNKLSAMTEPGGRLTQDFSYAPFDYNQNTDPGTQFRLQQGLNAMNATAAARGGLISGNALKAGQDYGQAQGSQEYGNAFNRYLSNYANAQNTFQLNRNNLTEPLKFLTSIGQAAGSNQAANIGNFANASAANTIGAANANAAGQIGSANAYNSAIGQGINAYQTNQLINAVGNRSAYGNNSIGNLSTTDANSYGAGWGPTGYTGTTN